MFTIDQIKEAHAKVKSGKGFPGYVRVLIKLGVVHYDTYVTDGHTHFVEKEAYQVSTPSKYPDIKKNKIPIPKSLPPTCGGTRTVEATTSVSAKKPRRPACRNGRLIHGK